MGRKNDNMSIGDIYSYLSENQYVYFATTFDKQPKVRPMVLFFFKGRFFFITNTGDSKVLQIKNNKLCEVIYPIKDEHGNQGYIKMIGTACINNDTNDKQEAEYFCYFFDNMYEGVDDPDFTLIELDFDSFEFFKPGETHVVKIHA